MTRGLSRFGADHLAEAIVILKYYPRDQLGLCCQRIPYRTCTHRQEMESSLHDRNISILYAYTTLTNVCPSWIC